MKTAIRKVIYGVILTTVLTVGTVVPAGTASAVTVEELVAQIQKLMAQLESLRQQLGLATPQTFLVDLRYGMRNSEEVRVLQRFLIGRGHLADGFATGNFFALTRDAVSGFQRARGLPVTGVFDAATRSAANRLAQGGEVAVAATSTPVVEQTVATATMRSEHQLDPRPTYDLVAIERAAFDAVNVERQRYGLNALIWNEYVASVARAHSVDQAGDNGVITDPDVACLYPFIRHEGFVSGFKSGDRLARIGIRYRLAGENIIILPMTKNLIYQAEEPAPACNKASEGEGPEGESIETARMRITAMLDQRKALMAGQEPLNWVNREWKGVLEIARESAEDWMNSLGHRENILTPEFEEAAIGAAVVNDYIILTQVFLKAPAL